VPATIAETLGAKDGLADHIQERELMVLLDNLEHVIDAAPELASLLERCPNLRLLVTSRELLRVRGEVEYAVPPLTLPEATELFCERSKLQPTESVDELCRRLDNLPLAVELAAARTNVLTPPQILERLSKRLDLLRGGRDAETRQQTLRATIEWSYDLLEPEEKTLFERLAVFRGGWRSRRPSRSATPTWSCSALSSTRASRGAGAPTASACSRRSVSSPPSAGRDVLATERSRQRCGRTSPCGEETRRVLWHC
jgi:predicted ATPase